MNPAAHSTGRFFDRRTSLTMRRWGSPKTPTIVCRGRKPGNRYESERRRKGLEEDRIPQSCQVSASAQPRSNPLPERVPAPPTHLFHPHESPKTLLSVRDIHERFHRPDPDPRAVLVAPVRECTRRPRLLSAGDLAVLGNPRSLSPDRGRDERADCSQCSQPSLSNCYHVSRALAICQRHIRSIFLTGEARL